MTDPYKVLADHHVAFGKFEHPAVFTVEEAERMAGHVPGAAAKNLFLESEKGGNFYLVTLTYKKRANLRHLNNFLNEKKLHFASPEKLLAMLGVTPGAVSPLGVINDAGHKVTFVLDRDFLNEKQINFHPNVNTASLVVAMPEFLRLMQSLGYEPLLYATPVEEPTQTG
jgi:Ala-tRNA(Pro) deacylase